MEGEAFGEDDLVPHQTYDQARLFQDDSDVEDHRGEFSKEALALLYASHKDTLL